MSEKQFPIFIIGAGGIVHDAHLPAYRIAGFDVQAIYDLDREKAAALAVEFGIPKVFESLEEMIAQSNINTIFDLAVPGSAIAGVLQQLPDGAAVLMQKPMGNDLEEARIILEITRRKKLVAAVNFQLRYAPFIQTARELISSGRIGDICGIEIYVNVFTPWHLWKFLFSLPRVEILYHSIHYVDLVRSFLGNPAGMYAKTVKHPAMQELASVKTTIIMEYGEWISANIIANHCHDFGLEKQDAFIKFEGTKGAIKLKLGLLMNYPSGVPAMFEFTEIVDGQQQPWKEIEVAGAWFPHAFIGSMQQVMDACAGKIERPDNSVEDAIYTMACVETAYASSKEGGTKIIDI